MEKWITYNIVKSDDLGEGTNDELLSAYADYEIKQITNYLTENYPGAELEVGHETNGLNPNCNASSEYNESDIIDNVSQLVESNFPDWLETVANSLVK